MDEAFAYTGRLLDQTTGLQNNLNRWYDASIGRWLSEDPIGFAAGDANLHRYVGNGPVNFVDPTGNAAAAAAPLLCGLGDAAAAIGSAAAGIGGGAAIGLAAAGSYKFGEWGSQYTTVPLVNWWYGVTPPLAYVPGLPLNGTPGTTSTRPGQTREYGPDGYPLTDVDCGHDHGAGDPHTHDWGRPAGGGPPTYQDRGPGRPWKPGDPTPTPP